jgi:hypothetical protein
MVVKAPIQERCEQARLKGCPEVVDEIVLYIEGDEPAAMAKLKAGAKQNSPEDIRRFSEVLLRSSGIPGAAQFAGPITQITKVLMTETALENSVSVRDRAQTSPVRGTAKADSPLVATTVSSVTTAHAGPSRSDLALYALTAPVDPTRTETESVSFAAVTLPTPCVVAGVPGLCVSRREGPLVVTDLLSLSGCPGRLFVGAALSDDGGRGLRWFAEASASGLTGARLFVAGGEWLQVILVPSPKADQQDTRCAVTWSGFRPRMVPSKI